MKIVVGIICALLLVVLGTTSDAQAQTTYYIGNGSTVAVLQVGIVTTCGTLGPYNVAPGTVLPVLIPAGCVVQGIKYNGQFFAIGYNGPVPPPNPPNNLIVTPARAHFY